MGRVFLIGWTLKGLWNGACLFDRLDPEGAYGPVEWGVSRDFFLIC